jgi:hypothetical protein
MNAASKSSRAVDWATIKALYAGRERAWKAGDATTTHLLDTALRTTLKYRRMAQAVRRLAELRATRQHPG